MASAATMEGIWGMLETLSLSRRNKRWLADKLLEPSPAKEEIACHSAAAKAAVARLGAKNGEKFNKEEQDILEGFYDAVVELKEIKAGRAKTRSMEEFLAEVQKEESSECHD